MNIRRSLIAAAAALAALGSTLGAVAQTMKAADVHPAGYPTVVAVENMGKKLDAATKGKIKFQMFPGSVLGDEKAMIEQTQVGAVQILRTSLGPIGPVVPEVNVFNMPFVFRDIAHMRAVIDGAIGQELLDKISASPAKMIGLAWMDGGSRSLYTKKPVRSPADLKGQKIRMMGNPLFVDTMNAMGGNGIAMGYGEVFTAIQTGVIDGAENNPPSLYTANHFKAGAKNYTQTNHLTSRRWSRRWRARRSSSSASSGTRRLPTTPPSSRPKASSSSRWTTRSGSMRPRRCAPSTARSTPT